MEHLFQRLSKARGSKADKFSSRNWTKASEAGALGGSRREVNGHLGRATPSSAFGPSSRFCSS